MPGGKAADQQDRQRGSAPPGTVPDAPTAAMDAAVAYVPRILLESLASHPGRVTPWHEWVDGTLVMADVSGFTAMSERLARAGKEGAEWLTDIINWYFGQMLDIAGGCGGTTLTFGGDAILLLFYGEDHERRGIAASLRMLNATRHLPAYRVANHRIRLSMSMGAHSGRFLTASVGTRDHAQYLVLGPETVETAKAESQASSGELAITRAMAERVAGSTVLEPLGDFFRVERLVDTPRFDAVVARDPGSVPADALAAYVPDFVADSLRRAPGAGMPAQDHEHRNVTIAFVNVLGVDGILAATGPDALLDRLQEYADPIFRLVREHQGCLVSNDIYTDGFKFIVAFGAPVAHEHDAANALRFACALRDELAGTDSGLTHRVGVNSGFVFAGDVGPSYRRQYTVMGDAVNLAARLMSAADGGQVLLSARTAEAAGDAFHVRDLAPIRVKGKEHPIPICALDGECEPPEAAKASQPLGLFGREQEMALVSHARSAVEEGQGRVVMVRGEAGMGKSRLAEEIECLVARSGWTVCVGRAQRHTSAQPFTPWASVISAIIGITPRDDVRSRAEKTLEAVGRMGSSFLEWTPLFDRLLGLAMPETDVVRALSPGSRRERMFDLVLGLLQKSAADAPLLVHIDDIHWADPSSLDLLAHVTHGVSDHRIMLLATTRLEGAPDLDSPAEVTTTIDLTELPHEAAIELMRQALGGDLPPEAAEAILAKTRGNPLFLHEVARSIGRSGAATASSDAHDLAQLMAQVQVPDRIQGLLMSSIDSLDDPARKVLRTASVVGTSFEQSVLGGVLIGTAEERSLDGILHCLVEHSLVEPCPGSPQATFRFRHALIQEVAYDSLMFSKRRRLHRRIGEYLESANAAELEPVYESLAHHYSAGRDDDKTLRFSVLAAGKARKLYAHPEAVAFYRDAMKAVRARTPEAAAIRSLLDERIGETYETAGRATEAARAFRDSLERWRRARRPAGTAGAAGLQLPVIEGLTEDIVLDGRDAELCHRIGLAYARTHYYYDQALRWLDLAMESLPRGRPSLRAKISVAESGVWYRKGDYERALEWGRLGLKTARRAGSLDVQAYALTILGSGYCDLGKLRLAVLRDAAALALYEELGDLSGQAIGQNHMGASLMLLGRFDEALEHYRTALHMFARMGNGKEVALVDGNIGELHVARGDFEPALAHLQSALDACDRLPAAYLIEEGARLNLARAHQGLLHYDEAAAELRRTTSLVTKSGVPADVVEVMLQQADLELEVGNLPDALRTCGDALKAADRLGHRQYVSRAKRILGRIAHAQGDRTQAEALILDSAAEAERIGAQGERGLALLALAELYAAWDVPAERCTPFRRTVRQAIKVLDGVGARAAAEKARALAGAHA